MDPHLLMGDGLVAALTAAAAALAGFATVPAPFGGVVAALPVLLGFTRIRPGQAADNPVRRLLLEALASGRWFSASDLARTAGVSRKTIRYHLHLLQRAALVVQRGSGGRPLFAAAAHARNASPEARLLEHPHRRGLWDAAKAHPGASAPDLARALGLKSGTAHFHLRVLERAGLLERVGVDGQDGFVAARPLTPSEAAAPMPTTIDAAPPRPPRPPLLLDAPA